MRHAITVLAATVLLSACQHAPPPVAQAPPRTQAAIQLAASIDAYKALVAQQIMAANGAYTFASITTSNSVRVNAAIRRNGPPLRPCVAGRRVRLLSCDTWSQASATLS